MCPLCPGGSAAYVLTIQCVMVHTSLSEDSDIMVCLCPNLFSVPFINIFMMYIQWGDSALMWAVRLGRTEVKKLVERGADLNLQNDVCQ